MNINGRKILKNAPSTTTMKNSNNSYKKMETVSIPFDISTLKQIFLESDLKKASKRNSNYFMSENLYIAKATKYPPGHPTEYPMVILTKIGNEYYFTDWSWEPTKPNRVVMFLWRKQGGKGDQVFYTNPSKNSKLQ